MTDAESFEEWQARTAPPDEAIALATSTTLPIYLIGAFVVAVLSSFEYGEKLAVLAFLVLWYPTGVLTRRWLRAGATLDEPRFVRLRWVRLALFVALLVGLSIGSTRELVLVVTLGIIAAVELRWHLLESAGRRVGLARDA